MEPKIPFGIASIEHTWPDNTNYCKQTFTLFVECEPKFTAAYFWAQQFWFHGGDGGYFGIQSDGDINGTRQKIAIFSIWKSVGTTKSPHPGSSAEPFGHEGSGYSCKIPFEWKEGILYKLEIRRAFVDSVYSKNSWQAFIKDMTSNQAFLIGSIEVPSDWGNLKADSNFFIEYFRYVPSCLDTPFQKSVYGIPLMFEEIKIEPYKSKYKTYGECAYIGSVLKNKNNEFIIESGRKR